MDLYPSRTCGESVMKAIMISIQPQWVEKILNGEKTIEIRKTMPKCELPCKCYIYCTKPKKWWRFSSWGYTSDELLHKTKDKFKMCDGLDFWAEEEDYEILNGKVVAEFTLNKVDEFHIPYEAKYLCDALNSKNENILRQSCLSIEEILKYLKDKYYGYAWYIENLKIYDKPRELSEFYKNNYKKIIDDLEFNGCDEKHCKYAVGNSFIGDDGYCDYSGCPKLRLDKPPQSWCYVEDLDEN